MLPVYPIYMHLHLSKGYNVSWTGIFPCATPRARTAFSSAPPRLAWERACRVFPKPSTCGPNHSTLWFRKAHSKLLSLSITRRIPMPSTVSDAPAVSVQSERQSPDMDPRPRKNNFLAKWAAGFGGPRRSSSPWSFCGGWSPRRKSVAPFILPSPPGHPQGPKRERNVSRPAHGRDNAGDRPGLCHCHTSG